MRELNGEEALDAVVTSIRRLFPAVSERQSRQLADAVIRDLASRGVVLAMPLGQAASEELSS